MTAALGAILAASLLGSPHCAGMCGPFVAWYAHDAPRPGIAHGAYHLGRLASYLLLGAIAGAAGAAVTATGGFVGISRGAALLSGVVMVAWGAVTIGRHLGWAPRSVHGAGPLLVPLFRRAAGWSPRRRALGIGLLTTLLPCGWLYVFVAAAAGTGTPWTGMAVMAAFWAGTLPMLVALGVVAQRAMGPLRRRLPIATAAVVMVLGLLTIAGRVPLHAPAAASVTAGPAHAGH